MIEFDSGRPDDCPSCEGCAWKWVIWRELDIMVITQKEVLAEWNALPFWRFRKASVLELEYVLMGRMMSMLSGLMQWLPNPIGHDCRPEEKL